MLVNQATSEINIQMLDQSVSLFNSGDAAAQKLLMDFAESPSSTLYVTKILKSSQKVQTRSYALSILLNTVKTRWMLFDAPERVNIRNFSIKLLMEYLSIYKREESASLIPILNNIILEIVKRDWPSSWPEFVPELIAACKANDSVFENNLQILKMLAEEVFDDCERLTTRRKNSMKAVLEKSFSEIFNLCTFVLHSSESLGLVKNALLALHCYLPHIPSSFVFESSLIKMLIFKLFPKDELKNDVMKCIHSIVSIDLKNAKNYIKMIANMFKIVVQRTKDVLQENFDLQKNYSFGPSEFRDYVLFLANFYVSVLRNYSVALESFAETKEEVLLGHLILLKISSIEETEILKICLEYWEVLSKTLCGQKRRNKAPITLGRLEKIDDARIALYKPLVSRLRLVLIQRMERPQEVLIVEDENGNVVREELEESYNKEMYTLMKSCLLATAELDYAETKETMFAILKRQIGLKRIRVSELNRLSWAIGSLSGAMGSDAEKDFLVHIIRSLLQLCDQPRGKDQKAVIASCIMHIVGQYPRFLRKYWRFLKTVANKLFEFMHEVFPGVKEMAVETFLTISRSCAADFAKTQAGELYKAPFVYQILNDLGWISADLEDAQANMFYEGIAHIVAAERNSSLRNTICQRLMERPNKIWADIMQQAEAKPACLVEKRCVELLLRTIRVNASVARGMGPAFDTQFDRLYEKLLGLFEYLTKFVSSAVSGRGEAVFADRSMKQILLLRSEILRLFEIYIKKIRQCDINLILNNFVPALYTPLLSSYEGIHPLARDHNVLSLFEVLVDKVEMKAQKLLHQMFGSVIKRTLEMVQKNFSDFPDHRLKFFSLLRAIVVHCFPVIMSLNESDFKVIFLSIFWAIKHQNDEISTIGLETIAMTLQKIDRTSIFNNFYKAHFLQMTKEILGVVSDTLHKGGFDLQTTVLAKLLAVIKNGDVTVPLYAAEANFKTNRAYVSSCLLSYFSDIFKGRLTNEEKGELVENLLSKSSDIDAFRLVVRDFLLEIKEIKSLSGKN